jgi:quercetin dioxygenase-like cupin family protein
MALHHAAPGEVVDLETWGEDLPSGGTKAIVKTDEMELIRMVLAGGKKVDTHQVASPVVIHCLSGLIEIDTMGKSERLGPGQLMHLASNEPHAVRAKEDSQVLLTVVFFR